MSIKTSKSFIIQDELLTKGIVEIYKEILRGDRGKFPNGTWQRPDALENAKKCIKYSIEEIYKFSTDEIVEKVTAKFFQKNKLSGMLEACFNNSPFDAINTAYPRRFKPWEFGPVSNGYWTDETAKRAIKWILEEKLKLTDTELKEQLSQKIFYENGLRGMLQVCFNGSPFEAINTTYSGKFKPWEFNQVPRSYWTKEKGIEAVRWLIEEKLQLTSEQLKEKLSIKMFKENKLDGMLNTCFNGSTYEAINTAYPNKFKKSDFKKL